ncbi:MAG: M4 family metallopeptidase [Vicinamibacterales bacterium]
MCVRHPLHCIVPPYIVSRLAKSSDPATRMRALANVKMSAVMRAQRELAQAMPGLMVSRAPRQRKHRLVYDARGTDRLPGKLARAEGDKKTADKAVNEAYEHSGSTYDFYERVFDRRSLDDNGMTLVSTVHLADVDEDGEFVPMNNAFWNGEQMAYGDGDGIIFRRFTRALEVVGHELSHGVQSFTSNLTYQGQSGALNEHFADVFGVLVRQWSEGEPAERANWVIGSDVLVPGPPRRGIRDMEFPGTAFTDDPDLGTDPQPAHMSKLYKGPADRGGVHINSGIPNRAFVLTAKSIGGKAWELAGRIWYDTLLQLTSTSQFNDCARISLQIAATHGPAARKAVQAAWRVVGLSV